MCKIIYAQASGVYANQYTSNAPPLNDLKNEKLLLATTTATATATAISSITATTILNNLLLLYYKILLLRFLNSTKRSSHIAIIANFT